MSADADQKIATLRASLSHLTAHIGRVNDELAAAQSALAALRAEHARMIAQDVEALWATQALCEVWQGRFREERRLREDAEHALADEVQLRRAQNGTLNGPDARRTTRLQITRSARSSCSTRPTRSHSLSSSSSSTAADPSRRKQRSSRARSGKSRSKGAAAAVILQLSLELHLAKREMAQLQQDRDDEVEHLSADLAFRRDELRRLYTSLDWLLHLGSPAGVLVAAEPLRAGETELDGADLDEEHALEDEVRRLEAELALRDPHASKALQENHAAISSAPPPAFSPAGLAFELPSALDMQDAVDHLDVEIERQSTRLSELVNERAALLGRLPGSPPDPQDSTRSNALLQRIDDLEHERSRLAHLLAAAEHESASLAAQLASTHSSLDVLAERVSAQLVALRRRVMRERDERQKAEAQLRVSEGEKRRCEELLGRAWERTQGPDEAHRSEEDEEGQEDEGGPQGEYGWASPAGSGQASSVE